MWSSVGQCGLQLEMQIPPQVPETLGGPRVWLNSRAGDSTGNCKNQWMLSESYSAPQFSVLKGKNGMKQMSSSSYTSFGQNLTSRSQPSHCPSSCYRWRRCFPLWFRGTELRPGDLRSSMWALWPWFGFCHFAQCILSTTPRPALLFRILSSP